MKRRDSRPLRTVGSISLCRSLLEAWAVDRLRVVVFPVITGATGNDRLFDGYPRNRVKPQPPGDRSRLLLWTTSRSE